jgi:hypothetical protein
MSVFKGYLPNLQDVRVLQPTGERKNGKLKMERGKLKTGSDEF